MHLSRLVQISDLHLYAEASGTLDGMNCAAGLRAVLQAIRANEPALAGILCTGDLSQDESLASYHHLGQALDALRTPYYWLPGNHDSLSAMHAARGIAHPCFARAFSLPGWRVILLNSAVAGVSHGELCAAELAALDAELAQGSEALVICLHHHPVPTQAPWLQRHALRNPEALFARLDACPRVRLVLFGHIHHEFEHRRNGVLYLGAPATSVQFAPVSEDFALDTLGPGYRWLELCADGNFTSGVRRVVDLSSNGH
jgi:Icc protein